MFLHFVFELLELLTPVGHRHLQLLTRDGRGAPAARTVGIVVSQVSSINFLQGIEHGNAAKCIRCLTERATDIHVCTPLENRIGLSLAKTLSSLGSVNLSLTKGIVL